MTSFVPFIDLKTQYEATHSDIEQAIAEVMESAQSIGGSVLKRLERAVTEFSGAAIALGVADVTVRDRDSRMR